MTITHEDAEAMIERAVRRIVPDADLEGLSPDTDLRRAFELDSLDFLGFVELLVDDSGVRLDEDDYPDLVTRAGCADLLVRRST